MSVATIAGDGGAVPGDEARHSRAWLSLAVLVAFVIISYVDRMTIVLMVEPIRADVGITDLQISYLQGLAFALCFGLAGPPLAWLADRYSRRWVIFGGIVVWSLATTASGLTMQYSHLLAARFLVGVGEAALMPAAFSLLADLFPRRQHALSFGILSAGAAVGGALAIGGGGLLIEAANSAGPLVLPGIGEVRPWQMVFLLCGVPGLPAAFLVFLIPKVTAVDGVEAAQPPGTLIFSWLRQHAAFYILFSLAVSLLCAIAYGVVNWTPTFFVRSYGMDVTVLAGRLALIQLCAGLVGYIGGGWLTDRLGRAGFKNGPYIYLMMASMIVMGACLGAFALQPGEAGSLAFLGLFHLVLPFAGIVAAALQMTAPRAIRSQVIAIVSAVYTIIGMVAGPSSIAFLTDEVLGAPELLDQSLTIVTIAFCPLILLLLFVSRGVALKAIEAARETEPQQG